MSMKKFYDYLFYWAYNHYWKSWGRRELPAPNAVIVLSMINGLNILTIFIVLDTLGIIRLEKSNITFYDSAIIGVSCLIGNYFIFLYKKRYLKIAEQYENESNKMKKKYTYLSWLYFSLSLGLPILITLLAGRK